MSFRKMTITDVAQHAGVSVTTVSLVLSGKGRISKKTADKVNASIETLGYVRNQQAASLRDNIFNVIGLILPNLAEPFYSEMASGVIQYIESQDKIVFLAQSGVGKEGLERCIKSLICYGVDGIIVGGGRYITSEIVEALNEQNIPIVCAARANEYTDIDTIRPDNTQAAKMATEFLINNGHRQIAYFGGKSHSLTRAERIGGYCSTLIQYGLPFRSEWIVETDKNQKLIMQQLTDFLHQQSKVSAIICHDTATALGVYLGAIKMGNAITTQDNKSYFNQEIAIVGFDDIGNEALYDIPVSFIIQPSHKIGIQAATRLIQRIQGDNSPPQMMTFAPDFIPE